MKIASPTWVQRNVSPAAHRLFGLVFVGREALHWAVNFAADKLNHYQADKLREIFCRFEITQYKFKNLSLDELRPYHFSKIVDSKQLYRACQQFAEKCDLPDFILNVYPAIIGMKAFNEVKFGQPLKALEPINHDKTGQNVVRERLIKQALDLATALGPSPREELEYRRDKIEDIGGDISAKVAACFMDVPAKELKEMLQQAKGDRMAENAEMVAKTVEKYQRLLGVFNFDRRGMETDEKYLYHKMFELVFLAEKPDVLLLYFLRRLKEARSANQPDTRIFDEVRYLLAPLAERLGLLYLADDFRDQFMRVSREATYDEIVGQVCEKFKMGSYDDVKSYLGKYAKQLKAYLERWLGEPGKNLAVKFRVKSPYSIWNKTQTRKEYPFDNVQDVLGIKIIAEDTTVVQLVKALLLEHNNYFRVGKKPIREDLRLLDLKATWRGVKLQGHNGDGMEVEIQIEDELIHWNNMYGKVATWWYNLEKELEGYNQTHGRFEPHDGFSANYNDNFNRIGDFCVTAITKFMKG